MRKYIIRKKLILKKKKTQQINSENIQIFLKHFSSIIKKDNLEFLEEYDREIFLVNNLIEMKKEEENPKLNVKYTKKKIKKIEEEYKDGNKISDKWRMFSENEHTFERYKRYKYIYNFGEPGFSNWERDGVKTYFYD